MFTNYVKSSIKQNRVDLSSIQGERLMYSKLKNSASIFLWSFMLVLTFWLVIDSFDNSPKALIFLLFTLFFGYEIQKAIGRILYKNPILILTKEQVFVTDKNKWFDLENHMFEDQYVGRLNLFMTYCMYNKKNGYVFRFDNWCLKDEIDFKKKLNYFRLVKMQENQG